MRCDRIETLEDLMLHRIENSSKNLRPISNIILELRSYSEAESDVGQLRLIPIFSDYSAIHLVATSYTPSGTILSSRIDACSPSLVCPTILNVDISISKFASDFETLYNLSKL